MQSTSKANTQTLSKEEIRLREKWESPYEFVLTILGYAIGLGNMWRFPYLCYKHGGGTFVFCYIVASLTVGIPYFFLELCLGQFMQSGILGVWKFCPIFKGIGWSMVVVSFYSNVYYMVILAWASLYLFNSIQMTLPWQDCNHEWNTPKCIATTCKGKNCSTFPENETMSSVEEYWERRLLQVTDGIEHIDGLQWELVATLYLMWIVCYFCLWKGIKWTGKIVYVTVLAPYILLLIVLLRAAFLPGATEGIKFFLLPDLEKLIDIKVWFAALSQVLYSLGVGYGSLAALGSYNDYHNNLHRQMLISASIDVLTSIFIGIVVFSILGYMSIVQDKPINAVAKSGAELAFVVYPTVVLELPWSPFWAIIFFLIIITIGIDSEFCCIEGFITALMDEFRRFIKDRRELFVLVICFIKFLAGLCCVTRGGLYVFYLIDNYAVAGWCIFTTVLLEGCAVSYIYGVNRFYLDLEIMFGFRLSPWWKICWFAISPSIVIIIIILQLIWYKPLVYGNYVYPLWANILGWLLSISSIICIPLYMVYYLIRARGSLKERLNKSIQPTHRTFAPKLTPDESLLEMQAQILSSTENK